MHHQKIEEAAALSLRIGREIARFNNRELRSLDTGNKLWAAVRRITGGGEKTDELNITAEDLNTHYAAISSQRSQRTSNRPGVRACSY